MNSTHKASLQPLRSRLKEVTKQAILEAAETTFAEQGLHSARMEDIASRAGTAVGTLYNYFGDRQALLDTLCNERRDELLHRIEEAASSRKEPYEERLTRFLTAVISHLKSHQRLFALLMEEESTLQKAREGKRSSVTAVAARADELVQEGVRAGVLRRDDSKLFAPILLGMVKGVLTHYTRNDQPLSADDVPAMVRFFLTGAGAHKS